KSSHPCRVRTISTATGTPPRVIPITTGASTLRGRSAPASRRPASRRSRKIAAPAPTLSFLGMSAHRPPRLGQYVRRLADRFVDDGSDLALRQAMDVAHHQDPARDPIEQPRLLLQCRNDLFGRRPRIGNDIPDMLLVLRQTQLDQRL